MEVFETIVIFKPNEVTVKEEMKKFTDIIQDWNKTKKVKLEPMGIRNLAYEVRDHKQGYYAIFTYKCHPAHIQELERYLRIDEQVLKFLTVKTDSSLELEDYIPKEDRVNRNKNIDAVDVLLGITNYIKKEAV